MIRPRHSLLLAAAAGLCVSLSAQAPPTQAWIARSNANAKILLEVTARLQPEGAGQVGMEGLDEEITDLSPGFEARAIAANREAAAKLEALLTNESDLQVRQDLQIMIDSARDAIRGVELQKKYDVPWFDVGRAVFGGLRTLLDDQIPEARRKAALVRLRKYAGQQPGTTPFAVLAQRATEAAMNTPGLLYPPKAQVERGLADTASFVDGIPALFDKFQITGYQDAFTALKQQLAAYDAFTRERVLPQARSDFRLPAEEYAYSLTQYGVDIAPETLAASAHAAFDDIQKQMQALAPAVAKAHGWTMTDYRDVIRELKKDQLVGDAILPHYQARLKEIEGIITREKLVSLPARPARIRLASPAETAASPAPNMRPPRMLGNTGEQGRSAASWTLTAHEARPGHEMQFAGMLEAGVSTARALFSFNSTNVEGWGLYAEWITQPFMPPDGQLISLQHRLMRAARAFLDPELQAGKLTPDQAFKRLTDDVVISEGMARQEVDRYTFRAPGQATSYFYGYSKLLELRRDVEKAQGASFNQQRFHDTILAQGLLPPALMREAVLKALSN